MGAVTDDVRRHGSLSATAISVVVPTHRADEAFRTALASVAACRPPAGEVIVVADGEVEGCARIVEDRGARLLATEERAGPAAARNAGAREARGQVVLFLDADVVVPPDLVGRIARAFEEEPGLDGLLGSYDDAPAAPGLVSVFRNLLHHHVHQGSSPEASSFWSGCGAIRAAVFRESGGFDERYRRPSVEDIELGLRLLKAGRRLRLDPSLQVKHLKSWGFARMVVTDVRDRALPWTELILRERRMPHDLNLRTTHRVSTAAVLSFSAGLASSPAFPLFGAAVATASFAVLVVANLPFYRRLAAVRGPAFLAAALPLHLVHYLCCAAGFGAGLARYVLTAAGVSGSARTRGVSRSAGESPVLVEGAVPPER